MRNYKRIPNRFVLQLKQNGKPLPSNISERDFDCAFYEPRYLGKNPLNSKESKFLQDDKNNPHMWEDGVFENSWEAVELGEKIKQRFRLLMKNKAESYLYSTYIRSRGHKRDVDLNVKKEMDKHNFYSLVILDKKSILRDVDGQKYNINALRSEYDILADKEMNKSLTKKEMDRMAKIRKELDMYYVTRQIFECNFSIDEYAFDGHASQYPALLPVLWKDFNINFQSIDYKNDSEIRSISEFNSTKEREESLKLKREILLSDLKEAKQMRDNVRTSALESSLDSVNSAIQKCNNIYFKGLRSLIYEYMSMDSYTNRFTTPREVYNSYYSYTSGEEIGRESFVL